MSEGTSIPIGTRVRVMSADQQQDLGIGTYEGEVPIGSLLDVGEELPRELRGLKDTLTPKIQLDSGEVIYGAECWWCVA